jgi:iron complex outermembrane recepter protein
MPKINSGSGSRSLRTAVKFALSSASLMLIAPQFASAQAADDEIVEIQVTGSRIKNRDATSNSPIVTVDATAFESQTGQNVESYLNNLPNYNPATTPTTSEDDIQPTAINGVGIATISLRGFGANRSLVLLDGKRPVPASALMVTDVNIIPSAMLERVEIISGGASAVYGADAIGGVTNFILRKNFKGAEFKLHYGITEAGDGEEFTASGVLGTDFADGRGNITVAMEHYNREAALERNRDFYTKSWTDPNQPSDDLFLYGSSGYATGPDRAPSLPQYLAAGPTMPNAPNPVTMKALFPDSPANTNQYPFVSSRLPQQPPAGAQYRFGPQGQIWTGLVGGNLSKYESIYKGAAYSQEFAKLNNYDGSLEIPGLSMIQNLKYNDIEAYASAPQTRYSFFTAADFEFSENLKFFSRLNFAQSKTKTLLYPTVPISGWEARMSFNPTTDSPLNPALDWTDPDRVKAAVLNPSAYANPNFIPTGTKDPDGAGPLLGAQHPVPVEVAIMLMSRPDPAGQWLTEMFASKALGRRTTENTNTYFQLEAGLNFELPFKDWSGEFYWSHGETSSYNLSEGNLSLQRWRALVNQPDWGRNATLRPNQANTNPALGASNVNFGTVPATCTSGFYNSFFAGDVAPTKDCLDMVSAQLQGRSSNVQDIVELNLQGGLFNLPAGELRGSIGASWRDNATKYTPDILESNISFLDQVIGIYPSSYLDRSMTTKDVYGELLVPVISDVPMLKKVDLELGYRTSSYEFSDNTTTFKVLANVQINDALKIRAGYNRANRAPNMGELFLELQQIFTGSGGIFNDACGLRSNASYGAAGAAPDGQLTPAGPGGVPPAEPPPALAAGQTTAGALSTYLICQAQMGPTGVTNFYGLPVVTGGNPTVNFTNGGAADFGNAWRMQVGNPNLKSEKADTFSLGFVFSGAGVSDSAWLRGFTTSVDWWKIEITDAIQQYSPDYAGYLCYGTKIVTNAAEAAAQAATPDCQKVPREPTRGTALAKLTAFDNQAVIETSGIDVSMSWAVELRDIGIGIPGRFSITEQATFLDYYRTKASPIPIDVEIDWKGSLGPDLQGTNPGAYDYRLVTTLSYTLDKFSVNLGWRYLPSVVTAAKAYQNAVIANNKAVAGGAPGTMLSFTPSTEIPADAYSVFALSGSYEINENLSIRAGIDNLFDVEPSYTGKTYGVTLAETTGRCAATGSVPGCVNPQQPTLARSGTGTGSKAYNDILGRRFFVGLKASF